MLWQSKCSSSGFGGMRVPVAAGPSQLVGTAAVRHLALPGLYLKPLLSSHRRPHRAANGSTRCAAHPTGGSSGAFNGTRTGASSTRTAQHTAADASRAQQQQQQRQLSGTMPSSTPEQQRQQQQSPWQAHGSVLPPRSASREDLTALPLRSQGADLVLGAGLLEGRTVLQGVLAVAQDGGGSSGEEGRPEMFVTEQVEGGALLLGCDAGRETHSADFVLGKLACARFLACARCKLWWMTPEWGSSAQQLPPETQFLLAEVEEGGGGPYVLLLPLIDSGTYRATLRPPRVGAAQSESEALVMRVESGALGVVGRRWQRTLYVAAGTDPFALVERGVAAAAALSGGAKPVQEKAPPPPSTDMFGWCTWDGFYSNVSASGIVDGLAAFQSGGCTPRWLIVDDGWQLTDVDSDFRKPITNRLLKELGLVMPEMDDTAGDFLEAELEVLSQVARKVPPSSSAGAVLEEVSSIEMASPMDSLRGNVERAREVGRGMVADAAERGRGMVADLDKATGAKPKDGGSGGDGDGVGATGAIAKPKDSKALRKADRAAGGGGGAAQGSSTALHQQRHSKDGLLDDEDAVVGPPAEQRFFLIRVASAIVQRVVGLLVGLAEGLILTFYSYVVEQAPPGSWPIRVFTWLAAGPARDAMLQFYADSGNFTRRLLSIKANGKFSSLDAGPADFFMRRESLGSVVLGLRERFGLSYVYVWHGLPAYWSGVATPEAVEVAKYKAKVVYAVPTEGLLEIEPSMAWNPSVIAGIGVTEDPSVLYNDMHEYLSAAGIDGVKVDCQAGAGLVGSALAGGPAYALACHSALETSIARHFGSSHAMNCMCHSTENIYRFRDTTVARASDDFYPRDEASFRPHIASCAYNGLFLSPLVLADWDMFQSKHPAALLHATARAVSGAAIYVSDSPGEHDFALLARLVLPDGSVLRPLSAGRPTRDCLFADVMRDDRTLLKVWNVNACNGIVAVFNLQGAAWDRSKRRFYVHSLRAPTLATTVRAADIEPFAPAATAAAQAAAGTDDAAPAATQQPQQQQSGSSSQYDGGGKKEEGRGRRFAVYNSATQQVEVIGYQDGVEVQLEESGSAILTLAPLQQQSGVSFAPLGLTNMINGGGAIMSVQAAAGSGGNGASAGAKWAVRVRGAGQLLSYSSARPVAIRVEGRDARYEYDPTQGALTVHVEEDALAGNQRSGNGGGGRPPAPEPGSWPTKEVSYVF